MRIRLISGILLLVGLYLIVSFSRDLVNLLQKGSEIEKTQWRLEKLRLEKEKLEKEFQYVQSSEFVEKQAREKLGLAREGETVLILPENLKEQISVNQPEISDNQRLPNWEKWRRLFF